jgi:hypothetical protein
MFSLLVSSLPGLVRPGGWWERSVAVEAGSPGLYPGTVQHTFEAGEHGRIAGNPRRYVIFV